MTNTQKQHPSNEVNVYLLKVATLLEEVADTGWKYQTNEASDVFARSQLPFVESVESHAEQLLAAARRCKHALRQQMMKR